MFSMPRPASQPTVSQRKNPRRCPSSDSLSLPHKRRKFSHGSDGSSSTGVPVVADAGLRKPKPTQFQRESSRSSAKSGESAGSWFDSVNKHVSREVHNEPRYEEDPPFFLGHHLEYSHPPHSNARTEQFGVSGRADGVLDADSENGDLRGVIDDLTVENKRLKQMLRRRKVRASNNHADDKLFEVRVHGMAADKKRELEALLKNFASSMDGDKHLFLSAASRSSDKNSSGSSMSNTEGLLNAKRLHTDSGYGSHSNSEQISTTPSNGGMTVKPVPNSNQDNHIKSYLCDIPDIWLPQSSWKMSQRSKMALVVRRLEQLFTGKKAAPGEHSQPIQQQEVARSAARADRLEDTTGNCVSCPEGSREARILPSDTPINLDNMPQRHEPSSPNKRSNEKLTSGYSHLSPPEGRSASLSRTGSPDQRPTRPLDLDIQREQVAEENIEYIRHLGLSIPHEPEGHWIYLNLLSSMAQIHTLNVTPEFVRRAIKKFSTKFELSKYGHQVRWKGGVEGTVFSQQTEQDIENTVTAFVASTDEPISCSKPSKTSSQGLTSHTLTETKASSLESKGMKGLGSRPCASNASLLNASTRTQKVSTFDYKPMFYKSTSPMHHGTSYLDDSGSSLESQSGADATGLANALSESRLDQHHADEGLMIFYHNPYFCSDFSGDKSPVNLKNRTSTSPAGVLGISPEDDFGESDLRYHDGCYFMPQFAVKFAKPTGWIPMVFEESQIERSGQYGCQPVEWDASGLAGITPSDNFAIDVKVSREPDCNAKHTRKPKSRISQTPIRERFRYQTVSSTRMELAPSQLPPPSYIVFTSSSSSDNAGMVDWSDSESDTCSSAAEEYAATLTFVPHLCSESRGKYECDDDDGMDDLSSVDMLGAARAANSGEVAAREREYILNHPGGATAIAASLAVTIGSLCESVISRGNDDQSVIDEVGSDESDESDESEDE